MCTKKSNVEKFRRLQKGMGATNSALSLSLGVSLATIEKRRAGKVSISNEVIMAMKYLRGSNGC